VSLLLGVPPEKLAGEDAPHPDRSDDGPSFIYPRGFLMDALLVLSLFLLLALLAARFGHDSREQLASTEEAFARQGFAWQGERP
jgi:hypothetical protein